jgi:hypothetical protein
MNQRAYSRPAPPTPPLFFSFPLFCFFGKVSEMRSFTDKQAHRSVPFRPESVPEEENLLGEIGRPHVLVVLVVRKGGQECVWTDFID